MYFHFPGSEPDTYVVLSQGTAYGINGLAVFLDTNMLYCIEFGGPKHEKTFSESPANFSVR
jgi:hypothetical protein